MLFLGKIAVTAGLLFAVISRIDFFSAIKNFQNLSPKDAILAFFLVILASVVGAKKWHFLLAWQNISISFFSALRHSYLGLFFNSFLPSSIGGDIAKGFSVARGVEKKSRVVASIVADRALGIVALVSVSLAFYLFFAEKFEGTPMQKILPVFFGIFFGGILTIILISQSRFFPKRFHDFFAENFFGKENGKLLAASFGLSVVYHFLSGVILNVCALALGVKIPFFLFFVVNAIVVLLTMIPISLNGVGVREFAFVAIYPHLGVAAEDAVSVQMLAFLLILANSLLGGVSLIWELRPTNKS